jgi:hypothetical protein
VLVGNALRVGLAAGRWQTHLLPYVPQLPLEWLAAATAANAWLTLRDPGPTRTLAHLAAVLALVAAAAAVETTATPHVHTTPAHNVRVGQPVTALRATCPEPSCERPGVDCLHPDHAPAPALASRSLSPFPSPGGSVPLRRLAGAAGLRQPPPDPAKEGPR